MAEFISEMWQSFLDVVEPHLPEHLHWNELCWTFVFYLNEVRLWIHRKTKGMEHWEVVVGTITYCFYAFLLLEILRWLVRYMFFREKGLWETSKDIVFYAARKLPYVGQKIESQIASAKKEMQDGLFDLKGHTYKTELPDKGKSADEIVADIRAYKELSDIDWHQGLVSGTVYNGNDELTALMTKVYSEHVWSNPLHPDIFPDVRKMEAEVVSMCCKLFHGDSNTCGMISTGGSESILLACKSYREWGRLEKGIKQPEMVIPASAHPAFDKAAHYLNMRIKHVPIDASTGKADVKGMRRAISRNTVMIVGSVPSFPHGVVDPIEDLAKLALKCKIGLHVDSCLGGFLVPFMKKAGYELPPFDFAVKGVTSISADTHKYGFSPKGSSVVMYSSPDIRKYQYFVQPNWSGGVYASQSVPGSRVGNAIAATWAAMMFHGVEGYVASAKRIVATTKYLYRELAKIPGIRMLGSPDICVVAFSSDVFDIFLLSSKLVERKWRLSPLQFPSGLHLSVTMIHTQTGVADRLINDVKILAAQLCKTPGQKASGKAALYGMSQEIPDRSVITEIVESYMDAYYSCETGIKKS